METPTNESTSSTRSANTIEELVVEWLHHKYPQHSEQLKPIVLPWVRKRQYKESWKQLEAKLSLYCKEIQFAMEQENAEAKRQQDSNTASGEQLSQFISQQTTFIWQELKEEILQIVAQMFQNNETWFTILLGLFDYQTVIDAVVSFLQMKERQWRQYPREWIERKFDEWMLPLETSGRDFFRFIISELRRLQSHLQRVNQGMISSSVERFHSELRNRAIRVLAYILSELIERNIMPIPQIVFLDDKQQAKEKLKSSKEKKILPENEKRVEDVPIEKVSDNPIQNLLDYVENLVTRKSEAKPKPNRFDLKDFITVETINQQNQREMYSRYRLESTGNVGPLKIKLPLYRNPDQRIRELEQKKKDLLQRQERLQQMKQLFQTMSPQEQTLIKLLVKKRREQLEWKKKQEQILLNLSDENYLHDESKKIVPLQYLKPYYQKVMERVGRTKLVQMQQEQYEKLLRQQQQRQSMFPPLFAKLAKIRISEAEELLRDTENTEKQQLIISSNFLVTVLRTQLESISNTKIGKDNPISYEKFVDILDTNENLKQSKFMETLFKVCDVHFSTQKKNSSFKLKEETYYPLLYKAVVENIPLFTPEGTANKTRDILNEITAYVAQGGSKKQCDLRLDLLEEYCLEYLMTPEYHHSTEEDQENSLTTMEFCLQYVRSLRDTIDVEIQQPLWQPPTITPSQFEEQQKQEIMKRGAYQFVESTLSTTEEKEWLKTIYKKDTKKQLDEKKRLYVKQLQQMFGEKKKKRKKRLFQNEEQEYFYYQQKIEKLKWDLYHQTQHYHLK